jgi:hypothetical protein
MQLVGLDELREALRAGDGGALKDLLLRDNGGKVLNLHGIEQLARLCAALAVRAFSTHGEVVDSICSRAQAEGLRPGGPQWAAFFAACEPELPLHRYQRTAGGSIRFDEKHRPRLIGDEAKMAELLQNPYPALCRLQLDSQEVQKRLRESVQARSTHPARLAYDKAKGSFVLQRKRLPYPASVSEADFETVQTETFAASNAALQAAALLFIARAHLTGVDRFEPKTARLHDFYRDAMLLEGVQAQWLANGVALAQVQAFLPALAHYRGQPAQGEPQVFVGHVPHHARLSVFTPFALYNEAARAKEALREALRAEHAEQVAEIAARRAAIDDELRAIRAQTGALPRNQRQERARLKQRQQELQAQDEALAKQQRDCAAHLPFATFSLKFGGSTPRNLAAELDQSLHTANVRVFLPVSRQHAVDRAQARSYARQALLAGEVSLPGQMPRFLAADASDAYSRRQRQALFTQVARECMQPLLEFRRHWRSRHDWLAGRAALDEETAKLDHLAPQFRVFVAGGDRLDSAQRRALLDRLALELGKAVRLAFVRQYGKRFPAVHDRQLQDCARTLVRRLGA